MGVYNGKIYFTSKHGGEDNKKLYDDLMEFVA